MYLENKVAVVDFTKARGLVKFQRALKHYQSLGDCKIYYSHFIVEVMYQSNLGQKNENFDMYHFWF